MTRRELVTRVGLAAYYAWCLVVAAACVGFFVAAAFGPCVEDFL